MEDFFCRFSFCLIFDLCSTIFFSSVGTLLQHYCFGQLWRPSGKSSKAYSASVRFVFGLSRNGNRGRNCISVSYDSDEDRYQCVIRFGVISSISCYFVLCCVFDLGPRNWLYKGIRDQQKMMIWQWVCCLYFDCLDYDAAMHSSLLLSAFLRRTFELAVWFTTAVTETGIQQNATH